MSLFQFIFRLWYYFRMGYATYITFLIGAANTITIQYSLLVRDIPALQFIFPRLHIFAIAAILAGLPLATFIGWLHMKRTPAWISEVDISVEANPYYYRLPPGHQKEVFAPLFLEVLRQMKKLLEANNLLTDEENVRIGELESKMETLIRGGYVGTPRRKM